MGFISVVLANGGPMKFGRFFSLTLEKHAVSSQYTAVTTVSKDISGNNFITGVKLINMYQ